MISSGAQADTLSKEEPDESLLQKLAVNRSVLASFKAEYESVKMKVLNDSSKNLDRKLQNIRYKIEALDEERKKLLSALPKNSQAYEFMKDILVEKAVLRQTREAKAEQKILESASSAKKPSLPGPAAKKAGTRDLHEKALKLVSQDKLKEASRVYGEIVLKNPSDDEAYLLMGHTYLMSDEYEKAEQAFHSAVNIDPENLKQILPFYENIRMQNPEDDNAYTHLGYAYLILGETEKAKGAFQDALSINPANGNALRGLGHLNGQ